MLSAPPAPQEAPTTNPPTEVPGHSRAGVFIALAMAAVIGVLTCFVAWANGPAGPDSSWLQWFIEQRTHTWTVLAEAVSAAGDTTSVAIYSMLACVVLAWRKYWDRAVLVAVAAAGAGVLVFFGKLLIGRDRPPVIDHLVSESNHSYPSGHALGAAVVVGILAAVLLPALAHRVIRVLVIAVASLFVVAVGLSRLYLGVHWPTDVLAGWLIGASWLSLCLSLRPYTRLVTDRLPGSLR